MSTVTLTADLSQVADLPQVIRRAGQTAMRQVALRGVKHLRDEVPKVTTNLYQGISHDVRVQGDRVEVDLIASARRGRKGARKGTLHLKSGKTKEVDLRPVESFDYAQAVAEGDEQAVITPQNAKAFLQPITSAPDDESYISDGSELFVVRKSRKGRKPNPYHERAFKKLEPEVPKIFDHVLSAELGAR